MVDPYTEMTHDYDDYLLYHQKRVRWFYLGFGTRACFYDRYHLLLVFGVCLYDFDDRIALG